MEKKIVQVSKYSYKKSQLMKNNIPIYIFILGEISIYNLRRFNAY